MVVDKEVSWQERLKVVDFDIIREQMARKKGCRPDQISELAVRKQMKAVYAADMRRTKRIYPQDLRPRRSR